MHGGFYCKNEAVVDNAAETLWLNFFSLCACCAGGISEKFLKKKVFLLFFFLNLSPSYPCSHVQKVQAELRSFLSYPEWQQTV